MASYKALANKNKERLAQQSKGDGKKVEDQPHYGGALDLLIISSTTGNPYSLLFKTEQTNGAAFLQSWLPFIKKMKLPGTNVWAFTLDYETMQWMQLDQNGEANSWPLGEFLAQDEVRTMLLDPACTKSLTFREFVNGPNISKSTAISNSDNWTGAPAAEDDASLDDIPSSTDAFTADGPGPSSAAPDGLHVIEVQKRGLPHAHILIYRP